MQTHNLAEGTPHSGQTGQIIREIRRYLPSQAPLKDFVHHNPLHAFQHEPFHPALARAANIFGYKVYLFMNEYLAKDESGEISPEVLDRILRNRFGDAHEEWKNKLLLKYYERTIRSRIGTLRAGWKEHYDFDIDLHVHPLLFRILCGFLDQGISIWNFPVGVEGFLDAMRILHSGSPITFLRSKRAIGLLLDTSCTEERLLGMLAGDQALHEHYLFDQQFAHPGWSGIVAAIEHNPESLIDGKKISPRDLVHFELLLEIDALDIKFGTAWQPLSEKLKKRPAPLFASRQSPEKLEVLALWQEAMEWTYYDQVLRALITPRQEPAMRGRARFQAVVCIDDREGSLRDYLERVEAECETYSTPGHFNVAFYFKPQNGKTYTKQCPAPITPRHLIKEPAHQGPAFPQTFTFAVRRLGDVADSWILGAIQADPFDLPAGKDSRGGGGRHTYAGWIAPHHRAKQEPPGERRAADRFQRRGDDRTCGRSVGGHLPDKRLRANCVHNRTRLNQREQSPLCSVQLRSMLRKTGISECARVRAYGQPSIGTPAARAKGDRHS
jgi:hypothetical protein